MLCLFVRNVSYTLDASFSEVFLFTLLMLLLVRSFPLTHLMLVLLRFSYAPGANFTEENVSYTVHARFGEEFLTHSSC